MENILGDGLFVMNWGVLPKEIYYAMKYFMILYLTLSLCCCTEKPSVDKLHTIVDSLQNCYPEYTDVMAIIEKDMGNYFLYTIANTEGVIYDDNGKMVVSGLWQVNGKSVLLYSSHPHPMALNVEKVLASIKDYNCKHGLLWFYAVCKKGKSDLLVQAANHDVAAYEIPEIRDFPHARKLGIHNEIIVDYASIEIDDSLKKARIYTIVKAYNRTNNSLYDKLPSGIFMFIDKNDTIPCNVDTLNLRENFEEDSLWTPNPELIGRYALNFDVKHINEHLIEKTSFRKAIESSLVFLNCQATEEVTTILFPEQVQMNICYK